MQMNPKRIKIEVVSEGKLHNATFRWDRYQTIDNSKRKTLRTHRIGK